MLEAKFDDNVLLKNRAIWFHLYNLKNVKNTHGGVSKTCNITKVTLLHWVFFTFSKLYKWYQIAQRITIFSFIF